MLQDATPQRKIDKQAILDAIETLRGKGWDINPYTVADEAKVARSALYRDSELMELLNSERNKVPEPEPAEAAPEVQSDSRVPELEQRCQELERRNEELEEVIDQLKRDKDVLLQKQQEAWQEGYHGGFQEGMRHASGGRSGATISGAKYTDPSEETLAGQRDEYSVTANDVQIADDTILQATARALETAIENVERMDVHVDMPVDEAATDFAADVDAPDGEDEETQAESYEGPHCVETDTEGWTTLTQKPEDEEDQAADAEQFVSGQPEEVAFEQQAQEQAEDEFDEVPVAEEAVQTGDTFEVHDQDAADFGFTDPGYINDAWLAEVAAGEESRHEEPPQPQAEAEAAQDARYEQQPQAQAEAQEVTPAAAELPEDFQPIDMPIDALMADQYMEEEPVPEALAEPETEQSDEEDVEEEKVSQDDLQNLLNKRFGSQSKPEAEAGRKGAGTKFVGGSRPAQEAPPQGFVMRQVPPDIRKACLVLGLRPEELTFEKVHAAWKKEITNPGSHPDIGGDTEIAVYLNTAKDQLYAWLEMQAPKLGKKFGAVKDITRPPGKSPAAEAEAHKQAEDKPPPQDKS